MKLTIAAVMGQHLLTSLVPNRIFNEDGSGCYFGAAYKAVGFEHPESLYTPSDGDLISCGWGWLVKKPSSQPCGCTCLDPMNFIHPLDCRCSYNATVGTLTVHLFDFHRWSVERISDWLKQYEPEEESSSTIEESTVTVGDNAGQCEVVTTQLQAK